MNSVSRPDPLLAVANRRDEIRSRVAALRSEIDALLVEDGELESAQRIIARYSNSAAPETESAWDDGQENGDDTDLTDDATLTVPEMIIAVINEHYAEEHRGVSGGEIFSEVRKRWKPTAKSDSIRPVIWRLAKAERIKKKGKFYYPAPAPLSEEHQQSRSAAA